MPSKWPVHTGPNDIPNVFRIWMLVLWERTDRIREVFGLFGNHLVYSETIRKPYWKQSESKRKAFGDTLRKYGVINTFSGKFVHFRTSRHFRIRKTNGIAFGPVWTVQYKYCWPNAYRQQLLSDVYLKEHNDYRILQSSVSSNML
jgi:hypothetical protein